MTDYDVLVKALKELTLIITDCNGTCDECDMLQRCDYYDNKKLLSVLKDSADAIEDLQASSAEWERISNDWREMYTSLKAKLPRWISVEKTPPLQVGEDGYTGYFVYANGHVEIADYTTDKFDNVPYFHVDGEYDPDITHWMPQPPPPKEET